MAPIDGKANTSQSGNHPHKLSSIIQKDYSDRNVLKTLMPLRQGYYWFFLTIIYYYLRFTIQSG